MIPDVLYLVYIIVIGVLQKMMFFSTLKEEEAVVQFFVENTAFCNDK